LIATVALMMDYALTIAASLKADIAAVASAFPVLKPYWVEPALPMLLAINSIKPPVEFLDEANYQPKDEQQAAIILPEFVPAL